MSGLLGMTTPPRYEVKVTEGKGRGVFLLEPVKEGSYVLEYEAVVYPKKERAKHEKEYIANGEGCFIIDVQTSGGWLCFDATREFYSPGRLMNHSTKGEATVIPFKPLLVDSQWRLGFIATRDLQAGEELTWDYGCAPCGIEWLKKRPKKSNTGEHKLNVCTACMIPFFCVPCRIFCVPCRIFCVPCRIFCVPCAISFTFGGCF